MRIVKIIYLTVADNFRSTILNHLKRIRNSTSSKTDCFLEEIHDNDGCNLLICPVIKTMGVIQSCHAIKQAEADECAAKSFKDRCART